VHALFAESLSERIHFACNFGESIVVATGAAADGIIPFTKRSENVGQRLKRKHDPLPDFTHESEPDSQNHCRQRPLDSRCEVARPEQDERDYDGGQSRDQYQEKQTYDVADAADASPLAF